MSKEDNDLITMGMDLGVYTISKLMASGYGSTQKGWEIMKESRAAALEAQTGMKPERLSELVQPFIDDMMERIKEAHKQK
jgi:hypothetical protein